MGKVQTIEIWEFRYSFSKPLKSNLIPHNFWDDSQLLRIVIWFWLMGQRYYNSMPHLKINSHFGRNPLRVHNPVSCFRLPKNPNLLTVGSNGDCVMWQSTSSPIFAMIPKINHEAGQLVCLGLVNTSNLVDEVLLELRRHAWSYWQFIKGIGSGYGSWTTASVSTFPGSISSMRASSAAALIWSSHASCFCTPTSLCTYSTAGRWQ